MARTEIIAVESRRKYHWPEQQLNLWVLIMTIGAGCELGFFVFFYVTQTQMQYGIPWVLPYQIVVATVTIVFLSIMLWLIMMRQLLPGIVLVGSFMCFVLWVAGLVGIGIELYGPGVNINSVCMTYVNNAFPSNVQSIQTLAWITQKNLCNCWDAAFAWQLVCSIFLLWMMLMAFQVNNDEFS